MRVFRIAFVFAAVLASACSKQVISPTTTPSPIPSPTPSPAPTIQPTPTTITDTIECPDIIEALTAGGSVWDEFSAASIGAPIQFSGYVFEIAFGQDLISITSDDCNLEIWLKGIPHSEVAYVSYTQLVNGTGTLVSYPDKVYMDEVLVNVNPDTLEIR